MFFDYTVSAVSSESEKNPIKNIEHCYSGVGMNNSMNYVKQIKNAKRGGYTPTIAKDINKHKVQKVSRLIEEWRSLANELKPQMQIDMALTLEECAQALDQILRGK